jgi:1-acyl-sn-glycerol-3-phosphate acyltransferase
VIARPEGWKPPRRPTLPDVLRTARAACVDLAGFAASLAIRPASSIPSTTTADGLAIVREQFARTVRRLGVVLEVEGAARVPSDGGLVFMWNQESHLDHLVLAAAVPRPFFSLYNNEVARTPLYGAHMRHAGHVHVDRNDEAQWRPAVARAAERVREGECVLVSPEGTRSWDGNLLPMKRGAFLLALAAERPIVCVTVVGGHARLPRGAAVVRAGAIRVVFSEPVPVGPADAMEALMDRVASVFEATKRARAI